MLGGVSTTVLVLEGTRPAVGVLGVIVLVSRVISTSTGSGTMTTRFRLSLLVLLLRGMVVSLILVFSIESNGVGKVTIGKEFSFLGVGKAYEEE